VGSGPLLVAVACRVRFASSENGLPAPPGQVRMS
jgi:hypothetical protein